MFNKLAAVSFVAALVGQVVGHGIVTSPAVRKPGTAYRTNCGEQIFNNVNSDDAGNIQALVQNKQASFNAAECNLNLCKGLQFADVNTADIQTFTAGQVLPIVADIRAPHTGTANVSVVDTATNTIIGTPLITFAEYASVSRPLQANQTHFSVTLPDLGSKCTTAGACVLQWWWDARSIDQTYESCVDFTMSGSGGSAPATSAAATSAAATSVAATSAPAATSKAATSAPAATSTAVVTSTPVVTSAAAPTKTAVATSSTAAPAATSAAPAPCGGAVQAREVRVNAKYARCGGIGFGTKECPEGLTCHAYNAYYSACI